MNLTTETLKQMAAQVVAGANAGVHTMSEGIAKIACDQDMNVEQVKRLVEAGNQIAYLSKMASADDRTFEFQTANYDDVISIITAAPGVEKQASAYKPSPLAIVLTKPMEKKASAPVEPQMDQKDMLVALRAECSKLVKQAQDLYMAQQDSMVDLIKQAEQLRRDQDVMEKIAFVAKDDPSQYAELCHLVLGHVKAASRVRSFPAGDVLNVKSLQESVSQSRDLVAKTKETEATLDKVASVLSQHTGMTKEAFIGPALRAAGALKRVISPGVARTAKAVGGVGTLGMAGMEVAQISQGARPNNDVWKSLHG